MLSSGGARGPEEPPAPQPAARAEEPAGAARAVAPPAAQEVTADPALALATATERPTQKQAAVQDAGASAAVSGQRPGSRFEGPVPTTQKPVLPSGRVSHGAGGPPHRSCSSAAPSTSWSSPSDTKLPYLLIDSLASCKKALATASCTTASTGHTLQDVCAGSNVVVQLNGRQLGSEDGFISLIKVGSLPHLGGCCDILIQQAQQCLPQNDRDTPGHDRTGTGR